MILDASGFFFLFKIWFCMFVVLNPRSWSCRCWHLIIFDILVARLAYVVCLCQNWVYVDCSEFRADLDFYLLRKGSGFGGEERACGILKCSGVVWNCDFDCLYLMIKLGFWSCHSSWAVTPDLDMLLKVRRMLEILFI